MPRRKTQAWNEIWYILEGSGIPVESTDAKHWEAAYDSPLATKLLDLVSLIGETQGSRISAANVQRIGQAMGSLLRWGDCTMADTAARMTTQWLMVRR